MLIALALAQAVAAASPVPAFFTGQRLLEICDPDPLPWRCSMYVSGVVDGIFMQEAMTGSATLCVARLTNRRAGELVRDFLRSNPGYAELAAASAVRAAVAHRLDCGNSAS